MQVHLTAAVESAHKWIDQDTGKLGRVVLRANAGDQLEVSDNGIKVTTLAAVPGTTRRAPLVNVVECGDAERALQRLVDLGYAVAYG